MKKAIKVSYEIDEENFRIKPKIEVIDAPEKEVDNLDFFYKNVDCHMLDAVYFEGFDLWVDDEGLITSGKVVCEYTFDTHTVPLAGDIVASKSADNLGRTVWFDENEDLDLMMSIIAMFEKAELKGVTNG